MSLGKIEYFNEEIAKTEESILKHTSSNFKTFVKLFKKLDEYKEYFNSLRPNIESLHDQIMKSEESIDEATNKGRKYIESITSLHQKKNLLLSFILSDKNIKKIENIIAESFENVRREEIKIDLLERVCFLYHQILINEENAKKISSIDEIPFFKNLKPRMERIRLGIIEFLDHIFTKAYESLKTSGCYQIESNSNIYSDKDIIQIILKCYNYINETSHFINLFINNIFFKDGMKEANLKNLGKTIGGVKQDLDLCVYNAIRAWIQSEPIKYILDISYEINQNDFHLILNGIWSPLSNKLNNPTFKVFDASVPTSLRLNYLATRKFLTFIENSLPNKFLIVKLKTHPTYKTFMKKWNLQFYFLVRMREIIETLEKDLEDTTALAINKSEFQCNFRGSESILNALKCCWDKETFILELAHNFLHLSIQTIKRLKVWSLQLLEMKEFKETKTNNLNQNIIDIIKLRNDILKFQSFIDDMNFIDLELNQEMSDIIKSTLKKSLQEISDNINEKTTPLIISGLYESCSGILIPNVKSISNTYRFTQRAAPTEASDYAKKLLEPVNIIFANKELYISEEEKIEWTNSVFEKLSLLFSQQAHQLIKSIQKTQDFLDRKQKKSEQDQGISDTQKMYMQLVFDIKEYETQLTKDFNFDIEKSENFSSLKEIIQNAEKWIR